MRLTTGIFASSGRGGEAPDLPDEDLTTLFRAHHLDLVRLATMLTGAVTATLFHGVDPVSNASTLTADSTGRYVMFAHVDVFLRTSNTPYAAGWIDNGHFHQLPLNTGGGGVAW